MSGPSPWTPERDLQLTADWAAGFTTSQIGERMGIGKNSVIGRAHRLRLPSRGSPINLAASQSWTEEDDATLRAIYGGFLTAAQIAARMGRTLHAISYRAKFLGLVAGRRASPKSRGVVPRPAARNPQELSIFEARAAFPSRPRAGEPGAAAATAHGGSSSPNLPEAAAMPPRVFLGTECKYPLHGDERPVVPRFCAEPVRANLNGCASPYCAAHYAECYAAPGKYPANPAPATWLKNRGVIWARG